MTNKGLLRHKWRGIQPLQGNKALVLRQYTIRTKAEQKSANYCNIFATIRNILAKQIQLISL